MSGRICLISGVRGVGKTSLKGVITGMKIYKEHSLTVDKIAEINSLDTTAALIKLIDEDKSFTHEMNFSKENIEEFLYLIDGKDYEVELIYIGLESDAESIYRVTRRNTEDNLELSARIIKEFSQSVGYLISILNRFSKVKIYDNTHGFNMVAEYSDYKFRLLTEKNIPKWVEKIRILLEPVEEKEENLLKKLIKIRRISKR